VTVTNQQPMGCDTQLAFGRNRTGKVSREYLGKFYEERDFSQEKLVQGAHGVILVRKFSGKGIFRGSGEGVIFLDEISGGTSGVVRTTTQQYKCLCAVVVICATMVDTHTHTYTDR